MQQQNAEPTSSAQSTISMKSNLPELVKSQDHPSDSDLTTDEEKAPAAPDAPPEFVRTITGWKWILVCAGFYASCFLYGLDNTIAADIQSAVLDSFGDISKLTWLGSGFPLGSIATILTL
jgi:hypothetical protein